MVVTDLDGTLLDQQSQLSERARTSLEALGRAGIVRVVATGRSLFAARRVIDLDFPIDFLAFSSGAGVVDWRRQRLIRACHLAPADVATAVAACRALALDFMVHDAIPGNHRFEFERSGRDNADFDRRLDRYADFAAEGSGRGFRRVTQLVAIARPGERDRFEDVRRSLPRVNVVLATSPLDHQSLWIEILSRRASKSRAAGWLAAIAGYGPGSVAAIGNDFNDLDLLQWAGRSAVVANAPAELRATFPSVAANRADGFSEFVDRLLAGADPAG